jgi:hypothetical protein
VPSADVLRDLFARLDGRTVPTAHGTARTGSPAPPPPPRAHVRPPPARAPVKLQFEDGSEAPLATDALTERRVDHVLRMMLPPPPPPR